MACELFKEQNFNIRSRALIERANDLITKYMNDGYILTVRQLYYRMVGFNYIVNTPTSYKNFARLINNARLGGLIDWSGIEDRGRFLREVTTYDDPTNFMSVMFRQYAEALWYDQPNYCEVWVEKDAVVGVIERPCSKYRVPFFSCRGHSSVTGMYEAGKRLRDKLDEDKDVTVIYLGDHDPSGLDITRDCDDRLNMFAGSVAGVTVQRVALSIEQINKYRLPPNPAKETDSRAYDYINQFGHGSWELDALEPDVLDEIVTKAILDLLELPRFQIALHAEQVNKHKLNMIVEKYPTIERWFEQISRRKVSNATDDTV